MSTKKEVEGPALWRAKNPEGYAVLDLIEFRASREGEELTRKLLADETEIFIGEEGEVKFFWTGMGVFSSVKGKREHTALAKIVEVFCNPQSSAAPIYGNRAVDHLIPFLKIAEPTKIQVVAPKV